jgi:predicted amidophosphoribosyltransferase
MVKAIKGDSIRGYFSSQVGGKWRKYNQSNVKEFVERVPRALATNIRRHFDQPATIVPIPNSHVVSATTADFKTLEFATKVAEHSGGKFKVAPALVFGEVQKKSREGGPREASHFEKAYRVLQAIDGPIILFDDVCTGGGHLIGAHWRLNTQKSPVVLACTFGRSTKQQLENPVGLLAEELDVSKI